MTDLKSWTEAEAAAVALVAEFMGAITGLKPPTERSLFPPHMLPPLRKLLDGLAALPRPEPSQAATIEECAKVADNWERLGRMYPGDAGRHVSAAIARAIRALSPPSKDGTTGETE